MSGELAQRALTENSSLEAQIAELARRQFRAERGAARWLSGLGGRFGGGLKALPIELQSKISDAVRGGLERSYALAGSPQMMRHRPGSDRAHKLAGAAAGAMGGAGGLATAILELPLTVTMIFSAVQRVAADYGEDPAAPETCADCLHIFAAPGPEESHAFDAALLGARIALQGPALQKLIARAAPRLAAVLSQKLAAQAAPVLGAAAGAGVNYAFISYYTELAHVHFGLKALGRQHDQEAVLDAFHAALEAQGRPLIRV